MDISDECKTDEDFALVEKTARCINTYFGIMLKEMENDTFGKESNECKIAYNELHSCLTSLNELCDHKGISRLSSYNIDNVDEVNLLVGEFMMDSMNH